MINEWLYQIFDTLTSPRQQNDVQQKNFPVSSDNSLRNTQFIDSYLRLVLVQQFWYEKMKYKELFFRTLRIFFNHILFPVSINRGVKKQRKNKGQHLWKTDHWLATERSKKWPQKYQRYFVTWSVVVRNEFARWHFVFVSMNYENGGIVLCLVTRLMN